MRIRLTLTSFTVLFSFFLLSCSQNQYTNGEISLADAASNHGKYFGSAVSYGALFNEKLPSISEKYRKTAEAQCNLITPESEMKMANIWVSETVIDYSKPDAIAGWALKNGMKMRAHTLVWHRSLPSWLVEGYKSGRYTQADIEHLVEWYITQLMTHYTLSYPGLIIAWDVVNEVIGPNDPTLDTAYGLRQPGYDYERKGEDFWRLTMGDDYAEKAFIWAHEADPNAQLFYNDYHNEYFNPKGTAIYNFVTALQDKGIPINGIGLQCHFSLEYLTMNKEGINFSLQSISNTIDAWIKTGLDVQITEADVAMKALQDGKQSEFYAALLEASLLKTGVSAFVTWGFTDLVSWKKDDFPLYFDSFINPKKSFFSMYDTLSSWQHMLQ